MGLGYGLYNYIPGYHFDAMTWSVCSSNPFHNLNMTWNDGMMKLQCDSLMYQSPNGGLQGGFFPLFGNNYSTVPFQLAQLTFDQFQQQMNNGFWGNPCLGGMNGNNWLNNNNWWNNNNGNNGGSTSGTAEAKELNNLKSLIEQLKKVDGVWTDSMAKAYNEALKKSSNEEKIKAVKELLSDVDNDIITKAILEKSDIKDALVKAGYNFSLGESNENKDDEALKTNLESAHQDLKEGKIDKIFQCIASDGESGANVLRNLSCWNSMYPEDKGILGMIASKIPNTNRTTWKGAIHNITMQLVTKSNEYGDLSKKKDAIKEDLKKIDEAFDNGKDSATIKSLVNKMLPKFNELYCDLRVREAQKVNKKIRETYKIDGVSEDIVLASTKSDLEEEGFSNVKIEAEKITTPKKTVNHSSLKGQPADKQIDALVKGELLEETDFEGIYSTKTGSSNADEKFYGIKDDKLVEYVGVKSADEITDETPTKEVKDTRDIQNYANAVSKVDELISEGKIKERASINGVRIYYAVDKTDKGWQYFVIRNNKLMEVNIDNIINPNTVVMKNGSKKDFSDLTDSDFKVFSTVHVKATSEEEDDEEEKKADKAKEKEEKKGDNAHKTAKKITEDEVNEDFETIGVEGVGKRAAKHLIGYTNEDEAYYVDYAMTKLEKDDVLVFLKGYFDNSDCGNGFFEQIAREDDDRWTNKKAVPMMKMVLDAIPEEYRSSDEYIEMREIYREYAKLEAKDPNGKFITSTVGVGTSYMNMAGPVTGIIANVVGGWNLLTKGAPLGLWNEVCAMYGNSKLDDFDDDLSALLEKIVAGATPTEKKDGEK